MTDQHFEISVHVMWRGDRLHLVPGLTGILAGSGLVAALEDAGLEILSYGTSDITKQWAELRAGREALR